MSDERNASDAATDQGQQLKRTHDTSFGWTKEDHVNDIDDSSKEGEDSYPEGWTVKEVIERRPPILRIKEARVKIEKADKVALSGPSTNHHQEVGNDYDQNQNQDHDHDHRLSDRIC